MIARATANAAARQIPLNAPEVAPTGAPYMTLGRNQCRFILGAEAPYPACGGPTVDGVWCAHHRAIVFNKATRAA